MCLRITTDKTHRPNTILYRLEFVETKVLGQVMIGLFETVVRIFENTAGCVRGDVMNRSDNPFSEMVFLAYRAIETFVALEIKQFFSTIFVCALKVDEHSLQRNRCLFKSRKAG